MSDIFQYIHISLVCHNDATKKLSFFFKLLIQRKNGDIKKKREKQIFVSLYYLVITSKLHFKILAIQNIRFLKNFVFEVTSLLQQMERYEKAD